MSLEVFYRPSASLTIKAEGRDLEEVFKTLAPVQEVLNNCKCGKCDGEKIRMSYRTTPDGHDIYELICETMGSNGIPCGATLALGNTGKSLFPRRYALEKDDKGKWVKKVDSDGKTCWLPNNGWVRWDKSANDGKGGYV